jgi:hypothetical protein
MVAVRDVDPRYAIQASARAHAVDEGSVGILLAAKLIACRRARVAVAAMAEADEGAQT